jgi:hypothetical protein
MDEYYKMEKILITTYDTYEVKQINGDSYYREFVVETKHMTTI